MLYFTSGRQRISRCLVVVEVFRKRGSHGIGSWTLQRWILLPLSFCGEQLQLFGFNPNPHFPWKTRCCHYYRFFFGHWLVEALLKDACQPPESWCLAPPPSLPSCFRKSIPKVAFADRGDFGAQDVDYCWNCGEVITTLLIRRRTAYGTES